MDFSRKKTEEILDRVKEMVAKKQMRMTDFYHKSGISSALFSMYRTGKSNITLLSVSKIAGALNVPVETIIGEPEDEERLRVCKIEQALKNSATGGAKQDCFFVADLSPEERETIELMRSNSEARAQIMLAKDMCKNQQPTPDGLSYDERETITLMRKNIGVRAQIMLVQAMHKKCTPKD